MAVDAYMVFKNYSTRQPLYLKSESTVDLGQASEPLAQPFKDAKAQGNNVFEVKDYSFDIEQTLNITSQSTGAGAGKVTFNPFSITRPIDVSSTEMFKNACAGTPFETVYLGLRKSSGGDVSGQVNTAGQFFVLFSFGLVAVKTISWAHDDESPQETVTFEFGAMRIQYAQQKADGGMMAAVMSQWNRTSNTVNMPSGFPSA